MVDNQITLQEVIDKKGYLDKFNKELIELDIKKITPNEWNPNRHGQESFQVILNSIKKFGFNDPVSVRQISEGIDEFEIIDGEHRWKACKELGFTKIAVINFGVIKREEAMTLTQLLNHKGKDDILLKAKMLKELQAGQTSLFDLLPGSEKDKNETIKLLDFDFSQFDNLGDEKEEQKADDYKLALKKAIELEIILRRIKEESKNENLRIAIEQYFTFSKLLRGYISD